MPDSEKITINMNAVDLGKVDLLVQEGVYSNRSDFIRTAIRSLLDKHGLEIQQAVTRHSYGIGVLTVNHVDLERLRAKGEKLKRFAVDSRVRRWMSRRFRSLLTSLGKSRSNRA